MKPGVVHGMACLDCVDMKWGEGWVDEQGWLGWLWQGQGEKDRRRTNDEGNARKRTQDIANTEKQQAAAENEVKRASRVGRFVVYKPAKKRINSTQLNAMDRRNTQAASICHLSDSAFVLCLLLPCTSLLSFFERGKTAWRTNISHSSVI